MTEHKHTGRGPVYMFAPKQFAERLEQEAMEAKLKRLIEIEEHIAEKKPMPAEEIVAQ